MNNHTLRTHIAGCAGQLEVLIDEADASTTFRGVAIVAHPHPLYGGDMNNKVVVTMAKAFAQAGFRAIRFNFRGVGASEGAYANGTGETEDLLSVITDQAPSGALALAGFSFGTFTVTHALQAMALGGRDVQQDVRRVVLVGAAAGKFALAPIEPSLHTKTMVLHGEQDDTVALSAVMDWARPQALPVTVVPAGSHFFHGQLPLLKNLVLRHLA